MVIACSILIKLVVRESIAQFLVVNGRKGNYPKK